MRRTRLPWLAAWLPFFLAVLVGLVEAQVPNETELRIRLRYSDGTAVAGETVTLQRFPEEESIPV